MGEKTLTINGVTFVRDQNVLMERKDPRTGELLIHPAQVFLCRPQARGLNALITITFVKEDPLYRAQVAITFSRRSSDKNDPEYGVKGCVQYVFQTYEAATSFASHAVIRIRKDRLRSLALLPNC